MMQLRRLTKVTLQKSNRARQANGINLITYTTLGTYNVIVQEITDSVYASIYGANIQKMLRISSPRLKLETFLKRKSNDGADNISLYVILIGDKRYKITKVYNNWVDIEFYETNRPN